MAVIRVQSRASRSGMAGAQPTARVMKPLQAASTAHRSGCSMPRSRTTTGIAICKATASSPLPVPTIEEATPVVPTPEHEPFPACEWGVDSRLQNKCQLSAYPDCIGNGLEDLNQFIDTHLQGVVGGVHILPFYPSSADRGFAPLTYQQVDPAFGHWDDVEAMSKKMDVCVDFMVNHISQQSEEFQDFMRHGEKSQWADLFIRYKKFWPGGEPTTEDLAKIYTRKPRPPYFEAHCLNGDVEKVWCTFDFEQIDIDCWSTTGREYIKDQLTHLCKKGAKLIRLDAFGYATKKKGTNCFFVQPDVWEILEYIRGVVAPYKTELLCEVHEHYTMQLKLASKDFWVYDFALPMLLLQGLYDSDARNIRNWLNICPKKQITTLDTHDGIGVVDIKDLMTEEQMERTKQNLFDKGSNVNMRYNTAAYGNLDIYQLNCTYYSALGEQDDWYLLARAIQFFTPGIPLVYYVGLLAGRNDIALLEETKVGRNINRHHYPMHEVEEEVKRPVVSAMFELCRFRNNYPAFNGKFEVLSGPDFAAEAQTLMVPSSIVQQAESEHQPWLSSLQLDNDSHAYAAHGDVVVQSPISSDTFHVQHVHTEQPALQFKLDDEPGVGSLSTSSLFEQDEHRFVELYDSNVDEERYMLRLKWSQGDLHATLIANMRTKEFEVVYVDPEDLTEKVYAPARHLETLAPALAGML